MPASRLDRGQSNRPPNRRPAPTLAETGQWQSETVEIVSPRIWMPGLVPLLRLRVCRLGPLFLCRTNSSAAHCRVEVLGCNTTALSFIDPSIRHPPVCWPSPDLFKYPRQPCRASSVRVCMLPSSFHLTCLVLPCGRSASSCCGPSIGLLCLELCVQIPSLILVCPSLLRPESPHLPQFIAARDRSFGRSFQQKPRNPLYSPWPIYRAARSSRSSTRILSSMSGIP